MRRYRCTTCGYEADHVVRGVNAVCALDRTFFCSACADVRGHDGGGLVTVAGEGGRFVDRDGQPVRLPDAAC